jgi:hypothetical protein
MQREVLSALTTLKLRRDRGKKMEDKFVPTIGKTYKYTFPGFTDWDKPTILYVKAIKFYHQISCWMCCIDVYVDKDLTKRPSGISKELEVPDYKWEKLEEL